MPAKEICHSAEDRQRAADDSTGEIFKACR